MQKPISTEWTSEERMVLAEPLIRAVCEGLNSVGPLKLYRARQCADVLLALVTAKTEELELQRTHILGQNQAIVAIQHAAAEAPTSHAG